MKKGLYILLFVFICKAGFSQDVEFSQYYANPLYLNPAFAGSEEVARIALNYRTLMPVSYGDYTTYSASFDKYIEDLSGGVGLQIMNDRQAQGAINELGINLIYAYNFRINHRWTVNAGLKASYQMNTVDARNLAMVDPESGLYKNFMFFDFSAGILSWYNNYYIGLSVDHLTKPVISLGTSEPGIIGRKYTLHGGMEIPFYNSLHRVHMTLSPNFIVQQQNASSRINLGLYLNKDNFTMGLWVKTNTNIKLTGTILMLGYSTDIAMLAYSYDIPFNLNNHEGIISGAHEVTFLYFFKYKSKKRKIKAIKCPRF
ncbi:MAG TPA: PorP/SprF family type IX secretion system membrane protein [Bacteroidales bacterium]|nr:PorP/SprF family type IX secretion system membrane protein [Bacteroidales bacterium]